MAYSTINKSSDYMTTNQYTGTSGNQTFNLGFQPDWIWTKNQNNGYNQVLVDSIRGNTKVISSSNSNAEGTCTEGITSITSTGYVIGANTSSGGFEDDFNGTWLSPTYAAWCFKANGSGSSNTDGSITSTVSANTTSGISICKYSGNGSNATVGHGLGSVPKLIIVKCITTASTNWQVYHASLGNTKYLTLNATDAQATSSTRWNNTTPTSSVFSIGTSGDVNHDSTRDYIAYCFAENNPKMFKVGSYIGNSSADGTFIYTGQKVSWFLCKNITDLGDDWCIFDNKRDTFNVTDNGLAPNSTGAQFTDVDMDFLSNGVKMRNSTGRHNATGKTYIYLSIGQPIISNSGICATAR